MTLLFTHDNCRRHDMGAGHPEQPARIDAILQALSGEEFQDLERREAPLADRATIRLVHPGRYVDDLLDAVPDDGRHMLDVDTSLCPRSGEAALRAAGAVTAAVDAVLKDEDQNAFCLVRPPGHHAEPDRAMGFCLFNNVAVGAAHARAIYGVDRVAVVDFDVHHGNGSQAMFEGEADWFYASSHQSPLYPGTGRDFETGVAGNILNVPLSPHTGSDGFRAAYQGRIFPALKEHRPDLIFISAGFDAHRDDPLAQLALTDDDYFWVTQELMAVADECCGGRIVSTLEGGYDLAALGRSAAAHIQALMGRE
ncbi:histone deacetylase family protein [Aestuariispira insulae]|uniref:Acetoin utilization deacetylase AcuC-like enzyme n=1 Tax=Aestuariispira insulae TaxID=1461337 RepID=A0A3D9HSL9_9PROT|nr:histone deacetylase family protein [Aestuariispira insulae]RED52503.1 acetoin utilization deacetylase AcuC-like enzyme [Aestuariispira insulae]